MTAGIGPDCRVERTGTYRNRTPRYWCLYHKSLVMTGPDGQPATCQGRLSRPIPENQILYLDPSSFGGGIALWGALKPAIDTRNGGELVGIHVHARATPGGAKAVDATFQEVRFRVPGQAEPVTISAEDAISYDISLLAGLTVKSVMCTRCGAPHSDAGYFAVTPHRKHLCLACGREYYDKTKGIGNKLVRLKETLGDSNQHRPAARVSRRFVAKLADYPGGVQIWGSLPAIVWTSAKKEEAGIHVHAFADTSAPIVDDTFGYVELEGHVLDPAQVRIYMAQMMLAHLARRVTALTCRHCGKLHFSSGLAAFQPSVRHQCSRCGRAFRSNRRLVSNPLHDLVTRVVGKMQV